MSNREFFQRRVKRLRAKKNELVCGLMPQSETATNPQETEFLEDQLEWDKKWEQPVVTYSLISDSKDIVGNVTEKNAVYFAMMLWGIEIPLELRFVNRDQNADIKIEFTNSRNDKIFRDNPVMLAYAYFPGTPTQGIIKFNDDKKWSLNGKSIGNTKTYNLCHTLIHEIGHSLGLTHSTGNHATNNDVLWPTYNGKLVLSAYDRLRIIKKYKNRIWENYQDYQILKNIMQRGIENI